MAKINVDLIYPIGSIYMNITNIDPGTLFGGTWEQIEARYLMGAGSPSKNSYDAFGQITDAQVSGLSFSPSTLGEFTHTLTVGEIPPHSHQSASQGSTHTSNYYMAVTQYGENTMTTRNTGGGQAHNNLPPTLVVYMWKRIS